MCNNPPEQPITEELVSCEGPEVKEGSDDAKPEVKENSDDGKVEKNTQPDPAVLSFLARSSRW
ncbi:hypothetical protein HOF56_01385 [Candidatus Peribacteria bacterium]|jgi:hypothetical protein|nr:hypothetical protein [Candidatus Peribacteria bacterium]MBT4020815.1 hypothetical protein [Candidatus Peribacteria bacterium]MBT4241025.1 hypothetical protein [Candidatus Peribacteria bacterium]MBT4474477.1 hypothetical protein [Candidatus Peribacteria bacterium]